MYVWYVAYDIYKWDDVYAYMDNDRKVIEMLGDDIEMMSIYLWDRFFWEIFHGIEVWDMFFYAAYVFGNMSHKTYGGV